ncbi:MAG: SDR family oxidoreductase [Rhodospirillales bacterium]|nr:SDR family oxidoreductase [Alphaproteobacteria bacterium]MCB9986432.1 SDR family oxidoreductase [Rhodospirillales bacterium]USO07022.1 MAG: SDR family oxidoreductase [Rhodospirillales bacterium]
MTNQTAPARKKLFCFGYGYVAQALAGALMAAEPGAWTIAGTTRDLEKLRALKARGIQTYLFDDDHPLDDPFTALEGTTHILLSVPPNDAGDPVFQFHADDIAALDGLAWTGLLSSTAVYGDRDGGWVDEESEIRPTNKRGSRRALAESQWLSLYASDRLPVHVFRLAGIYGPGRSAIDAVHAGMTRRIDKPGHAFNRVHVDDVVGTLIASMARPHPGHAYNVSDDLPAPSHELIALACEIMRLPVPPLIPFSEVDQAPMARSFYLDNKRVKNGLIKSELGVTLKYPDYRSGLKACYEAERQNRMPMDFFRRNEGGQV